jgi:DeoR family fructose operon transcriptional repressor
VLAEERRSRLLELVRQRGFAALPDLAEELAVSESTVRRDLDFLEDAGTAKRTHGGVFYTGASPKLPHFDERQPAQWDNKRAIDTLLLDGGTTTYAVARLLVGRPLQIVTNSLPVANLFASSATTDLVLVGGYVYPRTGVSLGPYANQMLASLNVRRSVLSVAGVNDRGFYNNNLLLVETERAMLEASEEVIVVADSSKFGHQSLAHLCPLSRIDYLVVDREIDAKWREKLETAGVKLVLADPSEKHSTLENEKTDS